MDDTTTKPTDPMAMPADVNVSAPAAASDAPASVEPPASEVPMAGEVTAEPMSELKKEEPAESMTPMAETPSEDTSGDSGMTPPPTV